MSSHVHHEHEHEHGNDHGHDHGDLRRASGRVLWIALGVLALFFFVEIIGGVLTNSLALISDAAHLLSDVAAIGLALFAQWFARRAASARRSYGYRRVEILAAQLNGFTLVAVAVYIFVEAHGRFLAPPEVLGWPMIAVATVGLVAQTIVTVVLGRAQGESLNVRGAYLHALTDAIQSVGVVIGGLVMQLTGWYVIDPALSVLIGLLVGYSGARIIYEASHVLIEGTPRDLDLDQIAAAIRATPGVTEVTDLHAWSLTTGYNALTAHVLTTPDADDVGHQGLLRRLSHKLARDFSLQHVTLQIEHECELCGSAGCGDWLEKNGR